MIINIIINYYLLLSIINYYLIFIIMYYLLCYFLLHRLRDAKELSQRVIYGTRRDPSSILDDGTSTYCTSASTGRGRFPEHEGYRYTHVCGVGTVASCQHQMSPGWHHRWRHIIYYKFTEGIPARVRGCWRRQCHPIEIRTLHDGGGMLIYNVLGPDVDAWCRHHKWWRRK